MGGVTEPLISPAYRDQLRVLHSRRSWGDGGHKYAERIRALALHVHPESVLDYGCGSGTLKRGLPEMQVREYDPGIAGKDGSPDPADIVVCTDVLEHIEPDYLVRVIDHLHRLTRKVCFVVISTRLAHSTLPDGRNAHLIVESPQWWLEKISGWGWKVQVDELDPAQLVVCLLVER